MEESEDVKTTEDRLVTLAKRSKAYVGQHFGVDMKWVRINSALWNAIITRKDHALTLTEADAIATTATAEPNEVLAVLALLSRPGAGFLRMEYLRNGDEIAKISIEEVGRQLKAWWRDKTLPDDAWRSWAGDIIVTWRVANENEVVQ